MIVLLYKTGGEYKAHHVVRLVRQVRDVGEYDGPITVLTDDTTFGAAGAVTTRPLTRGYPGWWSKMELYAPEHEDLGSFLYMDLDTTIVAPIAPILEHCSLRDLPIMGRAGRRSEYGDRRGFQSALMWWQPVYRRMIWGHWLREAEMGCTPRFPGGDDRFIEHVMFRGLRAFQDELPGMVFRRRRKYQHSNAPKGTRIILWCGKPRPWHVPEMGVEQ